MSGPRFTVTLSPEAERDYDELLLYGLLNWGEQQMLRYQESLDRAIEHLGDFPEIGPQRDDLCARCRLLPVEHHALYYRIEADAIQVVRILHERADAARHLPR
ncbi:MAG TPA: type II toxin-antitoxin system RelE/ParE family toxin [Methylomirabilota bacterium]|nr:type II toxin-antitoxin system RelE/ParE family toxin [Methylomirabilota bacterium]